MDGFNPSNSNQYKEFLSKLKVFERVWCNEIQADIVKLPNGHLLGTYDAQSDSILSYCFVPDIKDL